MIRRGLLSLFVTLLGCGLLAAYPAGPARAATDAPMITNISVGVAGSTASYDVCLVAPTPPAAGAVTVTGPHGDQQAPLIFGDQTCGAGTYFMQATLSGLATGSYRFKAACVILRPDANGSAPVVPCLVRDVGLVSNFQGLTVATTCQVDFTANQSLPPRNCTGPGTLGDVTSAAPLPVATPTATGTSPSGQPFGRSARHILFAEGYTGQGYHEYLSLLNPQRGPARVRVVVYLAGGGQRTQDVRLAAGMRHTLDVNLLTPRASTAIDVAADRQIVAERALYDAPSNGNGSIVAGAAAAVRRWYVAEGYAGSGFSDGLRIFNPSAAPATALITAYRGDGTAIVTQQVVQPQTRVNVSLATIAAAGPIALTVQSAVPLVVESVVAAARASGPTAALALPAPARTWYFPDGSAARGNEEYIALFNPADTMATVRLQLVTSDGYVRPTTVRVGPRERAAIVVQRLTGQAGLAAVVQADRPVVAQETRYLSTGGAALVDGATGAARSWGLADGYAGHGFKEWITLLNPGSRSAIVRVRLIGPHGLVRVVTMRERAHHRDYLYVNGLVHTGPVSAVITADRPVVAGRTLIFNGGRGLSTTVAVPLSGR